MKIIISNTSEQPLYQQIKEQIKEAIFTGELKDGEAMPSIRKFANDLKVSILTIRRVYEDLEQEGFITRQVGIGTFVSAGNIELLRDSKRRVVEEKMADMIILIDHGQILLEEEKDLFLDRHRKIKGDCSDLDDENRKLFLNLQETSYGFTGILKNLEEVQIEFPDAVIERPTLEDIMLSYVERSE